MGWTDGPKCSGRREAVSLKNAMTPTLKEDEEKEARNRGPRWRVFRDQGSFLGKVAAVRHVN